MTELIGYAVLAILTTFLAAASVLPMSKVPSGAIRGLDFPRQQYFLLALVMGVCTYLYVPGWPGIAITAFIALLGLIQVFYIAKFTPVWGKQSVDASEEHLADRDRHVRVIASNVKKSNRDYKPLIQLVQQREPDVVMAIEVDEAWIEALKEGLEPLFDHWIEVPKDNGYGMVILSKLELSEVEVRDLITKDVPSARMRVTLRNGNDFRLYVVHPEPPVMDHDTKGRDGEIALIGMEAEKDPLPAIVAGDLNDVAWSTTTRRFQRLSGLLDPRVGRGFFNTFSATMPWMRWPLDHLFHDPRFRLVDMERLPKVGSDHFPMWFVLALDHIPEEDLSPGEAEEGEAFEAKRMIVEEQKREREPIGAHWEDE